MKKFLTVVFVLLLIGGAGAASLYTYRNEVYQLAMDFEASQSHLESKRVEAGGLSFAYYESPRQNNAETIILVHGFAAYKENWLRFARSLTEKYHVIAVDLPGHGRSTRTTTLTYGIEDQVRYLHGFAEAVGEKRFHMVGNSMGGAIVSMYGATYPEQVMSLTLLDPAGIFDHKAVLASYLEKNDNPLIVKDKESFLFLMDFALEKKPIIPWPVTDVLATRAAANQKIHEQVFAQMSHSYGNEFRQKLEQIQAPTYIVWGDQDRVINYKNAEIYQSYIPGSVVDILPGIGHAPMIEIPSKSAGLVAAFIESH